MNKRYLYLVMLYLVVLSSCVRGQEPEAKKILDDIIEHAENNSLYRENIDWSSLKKEMYKLTEDAKTTTDLKPAFDLMLKTLNDTHGRIFHNNQYLSYYTGDNKPHRKNMNSETYNKIQSGQVYEFKTMILQDSIGYVRIVGLPMGDNQKMSIEIQEAVCEIIDQGAKRWIVDLRYNGGGNMFPMVEGISNLIGNGIVGGTKGVTKDENSVWQIKNGNFYYDEQTVAIENKCPLKDFPKIAVLTSVYTASSGEALAVILKNRPNTRFFGTKTMGLVTVTDWKQIDSLTAMSISVSYYKDRKNNVYDQYVDVDENIEFEPDSELKNDIGVNSAIKWLNEKK